MMSLLSNMMDSSMMLWLIPLVIWTLVWKGVGLWRAGRRNDLGWFVAIFVLNTAGILPIIYLAFFAKKKSKRISKN